MPLGRVLAYESNDPYFNLALEHAIIFLHPENSHSMTIRFWRNPKSVVVGRSQLIDEEVNLSYCADNGIQICRRISGGGAVYHDEGNLNVSMFFPRNAMQNGNDVQGVSTFFTDLLAESLRNVGYSGVEREGSYNILLGGRKISGAASYFTKNWVLHHATLLISANLEHLEGSLVHHAGGKNDKSRSRYQPTTNLAGLDVDDWKETLIGMFEKEFSVRIKADTISHEEYDLAVKLRESMYSRPSWIIDRERLPYPYE